MHPQVDVKGSGPLALNSGRLDSDFGNVGVERPQSSLRKLELIGGALVELFNLKVLIYLLIIDTIDIKDILTLVN